MANADEERIVMEIEAGLQDDEDGSLKASVAAGIDEQLAAVDAALKAGVPPDEYHRLAKIKSGLESANVILDRTWAHFHQ